MEDHIARLDLSAKTIQDAASGAREVLQKARQKIGMVPNMYSYMANAPGLLQTYMHGYELFRKSSGFTAVEQEVIFLSISFENGCEYCMAAHSVLADIQSKVPSAVTEALRAGTLVKMAVSNSVWYCSHMMTCGGGSDRHGCIKSVRVCWSCWLLGGLAHPGIVKEVRGAIAHGNFALAVALIPLLSGSNGAYVEEEP